MKCRSSTARGATFSLLNCLLLLTTAGYIAVFILALWKASWQIESLSVNPMIGPTYSALTHFGSLEGSKIYNNHQWWRLLTSLFVSSGALFSLCRCPYGHSFSFISNLIIRTPLLRCCHKHHLRGHEMLCKGGLFV